MKLYKKKKKKPHTHAHWALPHSDTVYKVAVQNGSNSEVRGSNTDTDAWPYTVISRNVVRKKCAPDNPKGNVGYDEYFLTLKMSKLLSLLSFSTRKHTSMASRAIL